MPTFKVRQVGDFLEESPLWQNQLVHYDYGTRTLEANTGEEALDAAVDELCALIDNAPEEVKKLLEMHGPTVDGDYYPTQGWWIAADDAEAAKELENITTQPNTVFVPIRLGDWR